MPLDNRADAAQKASPRETVIVVHGTYAAAKPGITSWWQPGGTFCNELDKALAAYGSSARCWAHRGDWFSWSGHNTWLARWYAARELRNYLRGLIDDGWKCHVVAHSHGGSLLLDAVRNLDGRDKSAGLGNLCTLGTPYLDISLQPIPPFRSWSTLGSAVLVSIWIGVAINLRLFARPTWWVPALVLSVFGTRLLVVPALLHLLDHLAEPIWDASPSLSRRPNCPTGRESLLAISCHEDEALRILSALKSDENPIPAVPFEPLVAFREATRQAALADANQFQRNGFQTAALIALWVGVAFGFSSRGWGFIRSPLALAVIGCLAAIDPPLILHVPVAPIRAAVFVGRVVWSFLSSWASSTWSPMRGIAWRMLQKALFGLGGSPYVLRQTAVAQKPPKDYGIDFVYEPLEAQVIETAELRRASSGQAAGAAAPTALLDSLRVSDGLKALKRVFSSVDLVHAAYYQDVRTIERVAVWLAMPADEREMYALRFADETNLRMDAHADEEFSPYQRSYDALWHALPLGEREFFIKREEFISARRCWPAECVESSVDG